MDDEGGDLLKVATREAQRALGEKNAGNALFRAENLLLLLWLCQLAAVAGFQLHPTHVKIGSGAPSCSIATRRIDGGRPLWPMS